MMNRNQIMEWLESLADEDEDADIVIDGFFLMLVDSNEYLEVGGLPDEEEED